jgi:hypothetical protein
MRYPDLDIDLLRCFATVAGHGGFTAAGTALGLTQSAVSLKIKRLEDVVRRRVFDRTSRRLSLTPDGETLLVYANRLLALNDEAICGSASPTISCPSISPRSSRASPASTRKCAWRWKSAAAMSCVPPVSAACSTS